MSDVALDALLVQTLRAIRRARRESAIGLTTEQETELLFEVEALAGALALAKGSRALDPEVGPAVRPKWRLPTT